MNYYTQSTVPTQTLLRFPIKPAAKAETRAEVLHSRLVISVFCPDLRNLTYISNGNLPKRNLLANWCYVLGQYTYTLLVLPLEMPFSLSPSAPNPETALKGRPRVREMSE